MSTSILAIPTELGTLTIAVDAVFSYSRNMANAKRTAERAASEWIANEDDAQSRAELPEYVQQAVDAEARFLRKERAYAARERRS